MSGALTADELRRRLDAAGARPTDEEFSRLLPILERRLSSWDIAKGERLDDGPPAFTFTPVTDDRLAKSDRAA